jgi:hypothetical protein
MKYASMFDELEKIAVDIASEVPDPHSYDAVGDNYITKDRLKRLGKVMLGMGIGGGLGGALGLAIGRKLNSPWGVRKGLNAPDWLMKYGPLAAGALVGAGSMVPLLKDQKKYIKHGDKP